MQVLEQGSGEPRVSRSPLIELMTNEKDDERPGSLSPKSPARTGRTRLLGHESQVIVRCVLDARLFPLDRLGCLLAVLIDSHSPADCGGLSDDEDFALSNYNAFKVAAGKTLKSIIISCNVRLKPLSIREVRELLTYDEMKLDTLGDRFVTVTDENGKTVVTDEPRKRTIIYGILSDTDRTFAFLFAIMMWQTIDQLCRKALDVYDGKLPNLVNFILDEFANIGEIPDVEKTIAVTRSRNIGMSIILQSVSQLESQYEKKADTIIDCCDTMLFLGGKSNKTNKEIAELIGKQTISQMSYSENTGQSSTAGKNTSTTGRDLIDAAEIGKMSRKKAILLIAGTNPLMDSP